MIFKGCIVFVHDLRTDLSDLSHLVSPQNPFILEHDYSRYQEGHNAQSIRIYQDDRKRGPEVIAAGALCGGAGKDYRIGIQTDVSSEGYCGNDGS